MWTLLVGVFVLCSLTLDNDMKLEVKLKVAKPLQPKDAHGPTALGLM